MEYRLVYGKSKIGGEGSQEGHLIILGLCMSVSGSQSHRLTEKT